MITLFCIFIIGAVFVGLIKLVFGLIGAMFRLIPTIIVFIVLAGLFCLVF